MTEVIAQKSLPVFPWMEPRLARLPGILPVEGEDWLAVDDAYAAQMALRTRLFAEKGEAVHRLLPQGRAAAAELYEVMLDRLSREPGFEIGAASARRPDGVEVALDPGRPLVTLGHLVQEDLCLMERQGEEHVLTGAFLCFPASWTLDEKIGRPLLGIHRPVEVYDHDLARRVQRLFDMIRPGQPLYRMNALVYRDPTLHAPRREGDPRTDRRGGGWLRSERQTLLRLPRTEAVLFAIHTYVVALDDLPDDARASLAEARL